MEKSWPGDPMRDVIFGTSRLHFVPVWHIECHKTYKTAVMFEAPTLQGSVGEKNKIITAILVNLAGEFG